MADSPPLFFFVKNYPELPFALSELLNGFVLIRPDDLRNSV